MSRNSRWLWILNHGLLSALALFLFHALIVKLYRTEPLYLSAWLLLAFAVVLVNREIARGTAPASRSRLQRAWAGVDTVDLAFVAFFFALLVVFNAGYLRATADGREYFAHVRSLVIDLDLDFANENELFRTGNMPGIFPFGSAVLWTPFFVACHAWLGLLNVAGASFPRGGFANPYQMAIGLGTLCYGFAGLLLAYRIVRDYYAKWTAAAAIMFVASGSFIVWYLAIESSYTHGNSLFAVTLFLFVWHRTRDHRSWQQWTWLGLAAGLMTMVRWQNAAFLLFPLADGLGNSWRAWRAGGSGGWRELGGNSAVFAGGFVLGVFPQLAFWKAVNGGWLALPHGQSGQQWWADSLVLDVLFSSNHGLFSWHPVIYLAALGIPLFLLRDFRFGSMLTLVFVAQIYINGAVATWWGGHAFGARRLASCTVLFALGLAALMRWAHKRPAAAIITILFVLTLGNVSFMLDVQRGTLPTSEGISLEQVLSGAYRRIGNPFSFPANWAFARRYGLDVWKYDQLGLRMYNNLMIDLGSTDDERFLGFGWSGPEEERGVSFRWATGLNSIIVTPLKAATYVRPGEPLEQADYRVRFRAQPFRFDEAPPQSVEIWVNGRLAGRQRLVDTMHDYSVDVRRELLGRNLNVFRFRYAYAARPADRGGGDDQRQLAVRFERIEFLRRPR